jgi:hypothetical protein
MSTIDDIRTAYAAAESGFRGALAESDPFEALDGAHDAFGAVIGAALPDTDARAQVLAHLLNARMLAKAQIDELGVDVLRRLPDVYTSAWATPLKLAKMRAIDAAAV